MKSFSCKNLSFYYGKKLILNNVNFTAVEGDVIGLIGLNGVGKTTLLKIISSIIPVREFNAVNSSFLIDKVRVYPYMTAYQNLKLFSNFYKKQLMTVNDVLKYVGLNDFSKLKVKKYSLGMKQRLGIALCIINNVDIYLFDEPLNGLDIGGIIMFERVINFLKNKNKIIIISSHLLSELNKYCNKMICLNKQDCQFIEEYNKTSLKLLKEEI